MIYWPRETNSGLVGSGLPCAEKSLGIKETADCMGLGLQLILGMMRQISFGMRKTHSFEIRTQTNSEDLNTLGNTQNESTTKTRQEDLEVTFLDMNWYLVEINFILRFAERAGRKKCYFNKRISEAYNIIFLFQRCLRYFTRKSFSV